MHAIRKKLSHRFFAFMILLALTPVGITGYVTYLLAQRALTTTGGQHLMTIAEDHAKHVDAWVRERLDDIRLLAKLPALREACADACWLTDIKQSSHNYLALLNRATDSTKTRPPAYKNVFIVSPAREILAASTNKETGPPPDFKHESVLDRLHDDQETAFGQIYPDDRKNWVMDIAVRVRSEQGKTVAFIVATLNLSLAIDPVMTDLSGLGQTGDAYLVDKNGQMISQSRFLSSTEISSKKIKTYGVEQALLGKTGTAVYENYAGKKVMGAFLWLPAYEWVMLTEMTLEETLWPLQWIRAIILAASALVMVICLLMAYIVSRRVVRPIVAMAEASQRMAEGELEQRVTDAGDDEIGILASNFNNMAQQLSLSVSALQRKEESLQKAYNELKTAQAQLVQSEKMAAIGELVASVAHEMRNPLTSIKLNIQIIGRSLLQGSSLREHYEIALNQVSQLDRMFSDLLNYSRPLTLTIVSVSLAELCEKSLATLREALSSRHVHVHREYAPDIPDVKVDPVKIEQVLGNILKNAVEASADGESIALVFGKSRIEGADCATLTITDHGAGISPRHLQTIFQPFFTTKQKGTGLGLSIVKKIMDAHGGTLQVTSLEGGGTTFLLAFPMEREGL
ncbi:MAG: HAMP domain-containing protein [Desulfobulbus sp.]|jgi:signal transduction histidine kinase|uniref:ATP-binding protein n=1 Tax=Desulfobulbus sp. TaxID=895 RepID=UPI00283B363A|nr:ATP-binding protein [Desulfobulbus sp.]MDR2549903.1 HAMP domain-containing protein [Desulfobulbus sp.]